jgi:hypothetical protein
MSSVLRDDSTVSDATQEEYSVRSRLPPGEPMTSLHQVQLIMLEIEEAGLLDPVRV